MHPEVYEPAEDTFLLLSAIDVNSGDSVFEIGMGTGIISLFCAQKGANVICSDFNPFAVKLVKSNVKHNLSKIKGSIEVRKGSLFDILKKNEQFSLIIFNPPYLPTSEEEYIGGSGWFDKAVAGGKTGLKTTNQFLMQLSNHLLDEGRAFIIFSTKSPREKFNQTLEKNKLKSTIISRQSFTDETIEVHKIIKK